MRVAGGDLCGIAAKVPTEPAGEKHALSIVRTPRGCGFGLWGHNPMLAIPVDSISVEIDCSFWITSVL